MQVKNYGNPHTTKFTICIEDKQYKKETRKIKAKDI